MALAFRSSFMTWLKAMRGRVVDADVDELPANAEAAVDHAFSSSGYPVAHRAVRPSFLMSMWMSSPGFARSYPSRALMTCFDQAAEAFGWKARNPTPGAKRDGDWLVGWGAPPPLVRPGGRRRRFASASLRTGAR